MSGATISSSGRFIDGLGNAIAPPAPPAAPRASPIVLRRAAVFADVAAWRPSFSTVRPSADAMISRAARLMRKGHPLPSSSMTPIDSLSRASKVRARSASSAAMRCCTLSACLRCGPMASKPIRASSSNGPLPRRADDREPRDRGAVLFEKGTRQPAHVVVRVEVVIELALLEHRRGNEGSVRIDHAIGSVPPRRDPWVDGVIVPVVFGHRLRRHAFAHGGEAGVLRSRIDDEKVGVVGVERIRKAVEDARPALRRK